MTSHRPHHEVELYRDPGAYTVIVDLPDHDPSTLSVHWKGGQLRVSASRVDTDDEPSGTYERQVGVPRPVAVDDIEASCEDGVLEVRLPIATPERAADSGMLAH
ncbi:Hsp20/alpha crystallin family protein [Halobacteriales archaeon Cl-PHB]